MLYVFIFLFFILVEQYSVMFNLQLIISGSKTITNLMHFISKFKFSRKFLFRKDLIIIRTLSSDCFLSETRLCICIKLILTLKPFFISFFSSCDIAICKIAFNSLSYSRQREGMRATEKKRELQNPTEKIKDSSPRKKIGTPRVKANGFRRKEKYVRSREYKSHPHP